MRDRRSNLHLDQFSGLWAVAPTPFKKLTSTFRNFDLNAHLAAQAQFAADNPDEGDDAPYQVLDGGVASLELKGVMTKYGSSLTGGGTMQLRRAIRKAMKDSSVSSVLLTIDSPGGTVQGTGDLADDFAALGRVKPTTAYIEDLCASAAYWVASQAGRIVASPNSDIGSIGTFAVIEDWSKAYEKAGVTVHVIKAGEAKGAGTSGTAITEEQLAMWQDDVNATNELFVNAVSRGRKLDAAPLADGRVRRADRAIKAGMVDALGSIDAALTELKQRGEPMSTSVLAEDMPTKEDQTKEKPADDEETKAADDTTDPVEPDEDDMEESKAATIAELKQISAAPEFVLACAEAGLSLEQAKALAPAFAGVSAMKEENSKLAAQVSRLMAGVEPIDSDPPTRAQVEAIESKEDRAKARYKASAELRKEFQNSEEMWLAYAMKTPEDKW